MMTLLVVLATDEAGQQPHLVHAIPTGATKATFHSMPIEFTVHHIDVAHTIAQTIVHGLVTVLTNETLGQTKVAIPIAWKE